MNENVRLLSEMITNDEDFGAITWRENLLKRVKILEQFDEALNTLCETLGDGATIRANPDSPVLVEIGEDGPQFGGLIISYKDTPEKEKP